VQEQDGHEHVLARTIRLPRPSDRPIVWAKLTAMFDR